ncbi:MAG TPA: collagen-binding domain-containing protein [Polyangiaceae bacterium]|jgi:choice-of-anchor A domain-containing protein|nr:collagen-binding domain-containing protein [Polyangiaceae bacterium]
MSMNSAGWRIGLLTGCAGFALLAAGCSAGGSGEPLASTEQALTQAVPFRVRGIDFTAFFDSDTVHQGNCGSGPVDAETTTDPNGGTCDIGYTKPGEWLEYSISLPSARKLNIVSRVASALTGKTFKLSIDGQAVGGSQSAPSDGWQAFADRTLPEVSLTAGTHTVRVTFETGDMNLNYIDFTPGTAALPARVEAEDYQRAAESTPASNQGNACNRGDGVDKEATSDGSGGCSIGWTTAGEWLEYDVKVAQAGLFDITARLGSGVANRTVQINVDGVSVGSLTAPNLGWATFDDRKIENVSLAAGNHVVRVLFTTGDTNLNYLDIAAHGVAVTSGDPFSFGAASGYNVFVFQDLSVTPTIAGPVAAGRDINAQSFGYDTASLGSIGALAGRNFIGSNGSVHRDLVYGSTLSLTNVGVLSGVSRQASPIDFAAQKARVDALTALLATQANNGTTTISADATTIDFAGTDPARDVFTVAGSALAATDVLRFAVPATATVIVNVTGSTATFETTGMQLGGVTPGHFVWNFPQATTLRLAQTGLKGTVLAPNAAVSQSSSTLDGVLIATSLTGGDNGLTWVPFDGTLAPPCPLGDFDNDGTSDCTDLCPADPKKIAPGACGCGTVDVDNDHDGTPACREVCDNDALKSTPGTCGGCGLALAAAGTACADGICPGVQQCDATGHCGNPNACAPNPTGCTPHIYGTHVYWVCTAGATSWDTARAKCEAMGGQALAQVDTREENLFLATIVGSGKAWIGANDLSGAGSWSWDVNDTRGQVPFFSAGTRVGRSYLNWTGGAPSTTAGADCATIDATTQLWSNQSCNSALPYICERTLIPDAPQPRNPTCHDFLPGMPCTDTPDDQQPTPCVDASSAFVTRAADGTLVPIAPNDPGTLNLQVQNCAALCKTGNEPECAQFCVGASAAPPANGTCAGFDDNEVASCEISNPGIACTNSTQCNQGQICAKYYTCAACPTLGGDCDQQCVGELRCGTPGPKCGHMDLTLPSGTDPNRCGEVPVCTGPANIIDGNPLNDPQTNLNPTDVKPSSFPTPVPEGPDFYPADDFLDNLQACGQELGTAHPWCKYPVSSDLTPRETGDTPGDDKKAQAGAGSFLQFDVDPNMDMSFKVTPKGFGALDFDLTAAASLKADATVEILSSTGTLHIIDGLAMVEAQRCRAHSDLYLEVFGHDILPDLLGSDVDASLKFDTNPTLLDADRCTTALKTLDNTVDRAKKALRDAQELLRQYNQLKIQGQAFDKVTFCQSVTAHAPDFFPTGDCTADSPEATINRFIHYYENQVFGTFDHEFVASPGVSTALSDLSSFQTNIIVPIPGKIKEENWNIASVQFFLGPVPLTMQLEAFIHYGITGQLEAHITPTLPADENPAELVYAAATATPEGNAGVSLFVGVGFSAGPFEAAAGVSGDITLGTVTLPAHAGAGVTVSSVPDKRVIPPSQTGTSDGFLFPEGGPRKYQFGFNYDYNAKIEIGKILQGSLSAQIRVKFFFFSKRWSKELIHFNGLPQPGKGEGLNKDMAISRDLFTSNGKAVAEGGPDWGVIRMPLPFVKLRTLDVPMSPPPPPPNGTAPFSTSCVQKLFYDQLCLCAGEDDRCNTDADCCPIFSPPDPVGTQPFVCGVPKGATDNVMRCEHREVPR